MIYDFSDITRKEARVALLIDSTFKYDDLDKAKKLQAYLKERKVFSSQSGNRFVTKFDEYCNFGMPGASCPMCNKFLEGKGRLLCKSCIEELERISLIPQSLNLAARREKVVSKVHREAEVQIEPEMAKTREFDRSKYYVVPKRRFYLCLASAIALVLIINALIVVPLLHKNDTEDNEFFATIENESVPTSYEIDE